MMNVLFVALGSALGGALRYLVGMLIPTVHGFPAATCAINVIGSFLIGLLSGILARFAGGSVSETLRLVMVVGFCGGFTTFSTFSNESFKLLESAQYSLAAMYILISVFSGLAAVFIGYMVSR